MKERVRITVYTEETYINRRICKERKKKIEHTCHIQLVLSTTPLANELASSSGQAEEAPPLACTFLLIPFIMEFIVLIHFIPFRTQLKAF